MRGPAGGRAQCRGDRAGDRRHARDGQEPPALRPREAACDPAHAGRTGNPMTEPEPRDPRIDAAYRDAATDAPRAEIDDRIRAAAHRAVAAGPQSLETRARADARRSWIARWRVPVSIAATVVVAVTLAYMMEREAVQLARRDGV